MTDSRMTRSLIGALIIFGLSYGDDAHAQYRNNSLTLDAGAGFTFAEGSLTEENTVQADPEKRGNPIKWQGNFNVAYNQKLGHDRWWISLGFGMGFFGTGSSGTAAAFGDRAQEQIGNDRPRDLNGRPLASPPTASAHTSSLSETSMGRLPNIEDCPNATDRVYAAPQYWFSKGGLGWTSTACIAHTSSVADLA